MKKISPATPPYLCHACVNFTLSTATDMSSKKNFLLQKGLINFKRDVTSLKINIDKLRKQL